MKLLGLTGIMALAASLSITSCKNAEDQDNEDDTSIPSMELNSKMPNLNPTGDTANLILSDTASGNGNMNVDSMNRGSGTMNTPNRSGSGSGIVRRSKSGKSTRYIVRFTKPSNLGVMKPDASGVYEYAEVMPSYPGGETALENFIQNNLDYPQEALDADQEGQIRIRFAVDEQGKVYEPSIVGPKVGFGMEEAALAVVRKMPRWNPGRIKGQNVKTRFTLPITYQLY